jgi:hypothetical protein
MSKSEKLKKVLLAKGWDADVWWEPLRNGGIMCGAEGGYCMEIHNNDMTQLRGFHGYWLGYDFDAALAEANRYPKNSMYEGFEYDAKANIWFDPKAIGTTENI